ncbi:hypothetical protein M378DRAFT_112451 [Amanita muscaria Koide BX008]|uniref:Phosphoglycerate mutase-like protein n=1 Tax=Amanita muscaria (strain Koide BX008) TaxID=946122 RepID=A0A0C2S5N1_AMAMK|nr:hypothetical protein M378DRAFT_112451 [Amanita muscaria Koide BX008]
MAGRSYQVVPGFFIQDSCDQFQLPAIPPRFGLLDESTDRWRNLKTRLQTLNEGAEPGAAYKLFFIGRHGEGYHNVAEAKYGTTAWNHHWSRLNTDGEIQWGPDPELTQLGISQAAQANEAWKKELSFDIPQPDKMYCSPLTRALSTHEISFRGIVPEDDRIPFVTELCREQNGVHTCDRRKSRTYITQTFPAFQIEDGFTEEDELWHPDKREAPSQVVQRAKKVLDRIFETDRDHATISITAHGGFITALSMAMGHTVGALPTGGILSLVVKSSVCALN